MRGPCQRPGWYREWQRARRERQRAVSLLVSLCVAATLQDTSATQSASQVAPHAEGTWAFVQIEDQGAQSRPLPSKPFPGQKTKRCSSDNAELINGGCWGEMKQLPPCGRFFEYRGACWVPVPEDPRHPVSEPPRRAGE